MSGDLMEENVEESKGKTPIDKNTALLIAIGAIALIVAGLIGSNFFPNTSGLVTLPSDEGVCLSGEVEAMNSIALGEKVENYLNEGPFLQEGMLVKVSSVEEFGDTFYSVKLDIMQDEEKLDETVVFATKDGKLLFGGTPIDLDATLPEPEEPEPEAYPKTETPAVDMFIMSFCPYGLQAVKALQPVAELFGEKAEIVPRYVIYDSSMYSGSEDQYCIEGYCSMHGIGELNEDVRQLCIYKYEKDKFWDYMLYVVDKHDKKEFSASNIDDKWEEAANAVGIDVEKIKECQADEAVELLSAEKQLNDFLSVSGSPTIFINGMAYSGSRTPEAYKEAICSAFMEEPEECSQELGSSGNPGSGTC